MEEIDIKNIEDYVNNYIDANKDIEFSGVFRKLQTPPEIMRKLPISGEKIFSSNNIQRLPDAEPLNLLHADGACERLQLENKLSYNHYEQSQNNIQIQSGVWSLRKTPGQDLLEFSDNITSIKNIDIKQTLKKGQKILDKNEFFYDLDKIMTDKKFKNFYEKYFKDIVDIKVILLYMKLYETIQKEYFAIHNSEINNKLLAYMIKELMNNNMSRSKIMKSFHNFLEGETKPKNRNNYKKFLLDFFDKKNK
jgi:hypothetical protein